MNEKVTKSRRHSTAYAVDEIYRTLTPSCSLKETCKMANYMSDNLEEIKKVCDNTTINNIMGRIKLIADIETGRYPKLYKEVKGMSMNEFIDFVGYN